jgi:L-amino acid N-acyltransferase YncA
VGTRIAHRREDLLFEMSLGAVKPAPAAACDIVVVDRDSVASARAADIERQVFVNDNVDYRAGLSRDDMLFVAVAGDGRVLSYGFVLFQSFYKNVLREPVEVPMIGNCFTEPEARGRGLYPALLRAMCDELARRGHRRAIISCAPDNVASRRGIERAGFRLVHHLASVVLLSRLIVWQQARPF